MKFGYEYDRTRFNQPYFNNNRGTFNFTGSPNRYGLPPFYELHVWAWKANPRGAFADMNPAVSCEHAHAMK